MELKSMKRTKEETREYDGPIAVSEEDYPYGLQINLDKEGLEKLGLSAEDFSIGGKVNMICQAKITGLSESAGMDGDYSNVSIQITDLAVQQLPESKKLRDVLKVMKG